MSVSVWQQSPGETKNYSCDVAIIGAGIIGAYSAYTLAKQGRKVAVLETRFPAAGATGRNAGMCTMGAATNYANGVDRFGREKARELWLLTLENQRKTRAFIEAFGTPADYCGGVSLAVSPQESEVLERACTLLGEDGFEVSFSPTDPYGRGFEAALFQPANFGLDPVALVKALLENAGENLRLFAPEEVFGIHSANAGQLLVEARGINVSCEQVALCTNAYSPVLTSYFKDKIFPTRGQILLTAPLKRRVLDKVASANAGYEYFRQLADGSFLLGGGRDQHQQLEVGYDETPTAWLQATLEEFLQKYFPDVTAEVPILRRWAGTMGFSVDGLPMVGQLPYIPGLFKPLESPFVALPPDLHPAQIHPGSSNIWFSAGFTGHGMGWGMVITDFMLSQMSGQRSDGGLFDVSRFPNKGDVTGVSL